MGIAIHGKRDKSGGFCYRIWSTTSDSYITDELTEEELRETMLFRRLRRTIAEHFRSTDDDVARARLVGGDGSGLVEKWRRQAPQGPDKLDPQDPWLKQYRLEGELAEVATQAIRDHLAKKS